MSASSEESTGKTTLGAVFTQSCFGSITSSAHKLQDPPASTVPSSHQPSTECAFAGASSWSLYCSARLRAQPTAKCTRTHNVCTKYPNGLDGFFCIYENFNVLVDLNVRQRKGFAVIARHQKAIAIGVNRQRALAQPGPGTGPGLLRRTIHASIYSFCFARLYPRIEI